MRIMRVVDCLRAIKDRRRIKHRVELWLIVPYAKKFNEVISLSEFPRSELKTILIGTGTRSTDVMS